jgi:ribosomal-protein-alanine N-acetyltransferase
MLSVRDARDDDHATFTRLFRELSVLNPVPGAAEFAAKIRPSMFLVEDEGRVVGYGLGSAASADIWYVMHVVTAPDARGRGVGAAIMAEHARRARAAGRTRWRLNVARTNDVARRLYERCGMHVVWGSDAVFLAWADVARLAAPPPHAVGGAEPADDAVIERASRLDAGELAAQRGRGGRVLVTVRDASEVVGFASFDPAFPGAIPFRVTDARWVRALLEAMRPHARPEHDRVRLVIEGDEASSRAVLDAGAELVIQLFRMEGPVP